MDPDATEITGTLGDDVMFLIGDQMASGGHGNDTYFVSDGFINEASNEGDDIVFFANTDYSVPENVETASTYPFLNSLSGPSIWNVAGNYQDNTILVFGAQGEVHAGSGSDVITSRGARDRLYGDNGRDEIHAGTKCFHRAGALITVPLVANFFQPTPSLAARSSMAFPICLDHLRDPATHAVQQLRNQTAFSSCWVIRAMRSASFSLESFIRKRSTRIGKHNGVGLGGCFKIKLARDNRSIAALKRRCSNCKSNTSRRDCSNNKLSGS
jgi:hypothetical protein